jgi:hypothetical protein
MKPSSDSVKNKKKIKKGALTRNLDELEDFKTRAKHPESQNIRKK